jgi:hypothetical protein
LIINSPPNPLPLSKGGGIKGGGFFFSKCKNCLFLFFINIDFVTYLKYTDMKSRCTFILALFISTFSLRAAIIEVPGDFPTIQAALNNSASGDTIVVSPGTYFENINFHGKNVFLTSLYYLEADTSYISTTIIDGGSPVNTDTASCVMFCSGEDSTAVIQGFTVTGGGGTKWTDIHGAGIYREGGGILVELSSPSILHNVITGNACTDMSGVVSTGGGGIRVGDSNPNIKGNRISFNQARYGAGVVLNYTGCRMLNNVIASNTGGQEFFGGSGIWIYSNLSGKPKLIVNNTIVNNTSELTSGTGGISVWSATAVIIKNNIIYSNLPALQVKTSSATPLVTYSDIQGGYAGTGNIDENPQFDPESYLLGPGSLCIDAGDTAAVFNDVEDPGNPGLALFPSRGNTRNDIGAYGGPFASILPYFQTITGVDGIPSGDRKVLLYPNPSEGIFTIRGSGKASIYNACGDMVYSSMLQADSSVVDLSTRPSGIYFVKIVNGEYVRQGIVIISKPGF